MDLIYKVTQVISGSPTCNYIGYVLFLINRMETSTKYSLLFPCFEWVYLHDLMANKLTLVDIVKARQM